MNTISLNGKWRLTYGRQAAAPDALVAHPDELAASGLPSVEAEVPGNVELDLIKAGLLPEPFHGNNILLLRPYETYEWWYETLFPTPSEATVGVPAELLFHGVDCLATYWMNGILIGESDNMFIEHAFRVEGLLKRDGSANALAVRLRSPLLAAMERNYSPGMHALPHNWEQLWIRKAPHGFGWDIMPRAVSAGLWRSVQLRVPGRHEIKDLYFATIALGQNEASATVAVFYEVDTLPEWYYDGLELELEGRCGESEFRARKAVVFKAGKLRVEVDKPMLWWPHGYGEPYLYEVTARLVRGGMILAERMDRIGIRTAELSRTEVTTTEGGGEFLIRVNGKPILCKGSNWVPLDAFHSCDAAKYEAALELFLEADCNIVRCWGGNVYEDHAFFDMCDRLGLMVWQDFAMACSLHPQTEDFRQAIEKEATAVVRKLRNHPSLILWCGDNECDETSVFQGMLPSGNAITRQTLPTVIRMQDPYRTFLPSSPYMSPQAGLNFDLAPERHIWGPRDYYKSTFYTDNPYHFSSEAGYHGCPNLSSLCKFLDPEKLWPWQDNDQWITHAADMLGKDGHYAYRIKLMANQIRELFGIIPDRLPEFILASQISQAEAKKFFVESVRLRKWRRTGIIWWNMLDGWPQFSDAVVDYYGGRKLAYAYIRRSQGQTCLMLDEPESWHVRAVLGNDSLQEQRGTYRVWDADTNETLLTGEFWAVPNENVTLGRIRISHSDKRLLLLQWEIGGARYGNHYLLGFPAFNLEDYKRWLPLIAEAGGGDFDPGAVGQ
ncbi:glycoside hydrolase family 2 protein [Paenibacillus koleovorans]|uniref:glycoside hydrolase family 2 protein n=1 Tax=Paenibacillus koleovorans TaxID=121608 RepID=UPI0013E4045A|nr:glycoside hydrolase family 2 TIM barrel-domain containing protein [Paenibacillus koleovorans]